MRILQSVNDPHYADSSVSERSALCGRVAAVPVLGSAAGSPHPRGRVTAPPRQGHRSSQSGKRGGVTA